MYGGCRTCCMATKVAPQASTNAPAEVVGKATAGKAVNLVGKAAKAVRAKSAPKPATTTTLAGSANAFSETSLSAKDKIAQTKTPMQKAIKSERLEVRITLEQKQLLEMASSLVGLSVSEFALTELVKASYDIIGARREIKLTVDEYMKIQEIAAAPVPKPTPAMKRALSLLNKPHSIKRNYDQIPLRKKQSPTSKTKF